VQAVPKPAKPVAPGRSVRVSREELAEKLRCELKTLDILLDEGKFTIIRDRAPRQGVRVFVPRDEADFAELYGVEALQAWRKAKRRTRA
jgi:hypothetical protein